MSNIRIWLAIALVLALGAVAFQTLRIKLIKAVDKATQFEQQLMDQKLINRKITDQLETIGDLQNKLVDSSLKAEEQLANIKKNKYNVDPSASTKLIQDQVDKETTETIRCNELAGGQKPTDADKKNSICQDLAL